MSGLFRLWTDTSFIKKYARAPQANPDETAHCRQCGQRLRKRTRTCPNCGSAIDDETFEKIPRVRDYVLAVVCVIAVWAVVVFGFLQIMSKAG